MSENQGAFRHTPPTIELEISRRLLAEERLRASEERYRTLFEAIDEGFCIVELRFDRPDGRTDYRVIEANPAFHERTGFPEAILGQWLREAAPDLEEHWYEIYGGVALTGEPRRFEEKSDMLGRWFDVYAFRIDEPEDRHVAILFNDISERKRHEEQTRLFMDEISHRSKNMLALVQAMARQTAASGARDFSARFCERVQALSSAQDLLIRNSWKTVPLADLVRSQLAHFADLIDRRIRISGPPLQIKPDATQTLGLAMHELATNAAKYGALSNETGRIDIDWSVETDGAEDICTLTWREKDGPPVDPPVRQGFGSTVTTAMVETGLNGKVSVEFHASGLVWTLTCSARNLVDGGQPENRLASDSRA